MSQKRTKAGQKIHDQKLINRVKINQKAGFRVLADLPGMDKPKSINGFVPDLVALKYGKIKKIEEVETLSTLDADKDQQKAFREKAKEIGANFRKIVARRKNG